MDKGGDGDGGRGEGRRGDSFVPFLLSNACFRNERTRDSGSSNALKVDEIIFRIIQRINRYCFNG